MPAAAGRVRPSRHRQVARSLACAATFAALAASAPVHGEEPSLLAAVGESAPEAIVVQVVINRERKGQFFAAIAGGIAFGLDHRIPNGTPLDNYRYYVDTGREILGLPPRQPERRGWARMAS